MHPRFKSVFAVSVLAIAGHAAADVTLYERDNFQGRSFTTDQSVGNFERTGFNDRASSAVVAGEPWVVCEDVRFRGRCMILRPGQYPSLTAMGLNDRVSSVRTEREFRAEVNQGAPGVPATVGSQVTFYEREGFGGRSFTTANPIGDFGSNGFNNRASAVVIEGEPWEICEGVGFSGRCVVLRPGRYSALAPMGLDNMVSSARGRREARVEESRPAAIPVAAQLIFYSREGFEGRSFTADRQIDDLGRVDFSDRASSVVVLGDRWEACSDSEFRGRCVILRPGRYTSLAAMGLDNSISSARVVPRDAQVDDRRYAPPPMGVYDSRRRSEERLYEVNITSVRAVVGAPEQRCWVEREPVAQNRGNANVGGAVVGALIGGILGHQVGGGTGKDLATIGGAVAGGYVGSNVGRDANAQQAQSQNVQRCENATSQAAPAYWDVVYTFRGQEHRVQMATQPGPTITVNEQGEPRA